MGQWGMYNRFANVTNFHTCSACHVNLLLTMVLATDYKFVEFSSKMVSGAGVGVPVGVDVVRICGGCCCMLLYSEVFVEPVPASIGCVANFTTYLALWSFNRCMIIGVVVLLSGVAVVSKSIVSLVGKGCTIPKVATTSRAPT